MDYKLSDFKDEIACLQEWHPKLRFTRGLWGYKEVAMVLGLSPDFVRQAEFFRRVPPCTLWQADGSEKKAGKQVLRWKPLDVLIFRESKKDARMRRLKIAI